MCLYDCAHTVSLHNLHRYSAGRTRHRPPRTPRQDITNCTDLPTRHWMHDVCVLTGRPMGQWCVWKPMGRAWLCGARFPQTLVTIPPRRSMHAHLTTWTNSKKTHATQQSPQFEKLCILSALPPPHANARHTHTTTHTRDISSAHSMNFPKR